MLGGMLVPELEEFEVFEVRTPGDGEFERLALGGLEVWLAAKDDEPAEADPDGEALDDEAVDDDDLDDDDEFPEVDDDLIDLDDEWDEKDLGEDERHDNPHRFNE